MAKSQDLGKFQLQSVFNKNILVLRYVGLWPGGEKYVVGNKYFVVSAFFITSFFILDYIYMLCDIYFIYGNFEQLSNLLSMLVQKTITLIQAGFFIKNLKLVNTTMEQLNSDIMQPKNYRQKLIVLKSMKKWETIHKSFFIICFGTTILYYTMPIVLKQRRFPFDGWYPYPYLETPWYEISYLHQCTAGLWNLISHMGIDMFCTGLMAMLGCQFDMLCDKLANCKELVVKNDSLDINQGNCYKVYFEGIVEHHCEILALSRRINEMFSYPVFGQMSFVVILLCTALYRMSIVSIGGIEFITLVGLVLAMALQLFIYCWFGSEIHDKSTKLHLTSFHCEWIGSPSKFQKNLVFLMQRTNSPVTIYALHFFQLSMVTFTTVMRSSWSFFLLLKRVNN